MIEERFGAGLWIFGNLSDRFLPTGYKSPKELEDKMDMAARVDGLKGIEVIYPADVNEYNIDYFKKLLKAKDLKVVAVGVDVCCEKQWSNGALSARDDRVRKAAIERIVKAAEIAKELGTCIVNIWPGQDGYDYPLQVDYQKAWNLFKDSIREAAEKAEGVKLSLEYKLKEPRMRLFLSTAWRTLLLIRELGLEKVGMTLDVGHAFYAKENIGEVIALAGNDLFHLHFNDNYGDWDDDMVVGSIRLLEFIEATYWLKKIEYDGWLVLDIFPYREDPVKACSSSIFVLKKILRLVDRLGIDTLDLLLKEEDAPKVIQEVFKQVLPE
ncbi:MAG: xylose isomerase [Thermoprotei archaeon]|nr:MAG: xylose isomerase [Thermoprotei archaeon]RLF03179.1 MAG: xylose isomerase [Thermoprotei archaeon]